MITPELIEKTARYVKIKTLHEPAGHDWFHISRVWRMAKILQEREGGDRLLIEMAALLHNVGDHSYHDFNEVKGTLALTGMMDILEIEDDVKDRILEIVNFCRYKGIETTQPATLEAKIVQDANWLDSFGAIGIARNFAGGGYLGRPIHDPDIHERNKLTKIIYQTKKREGTSINAFYEKALHLPALMNTATARKIAEQKVKYLQQFLDEFTKEWDGEDVNEILGIAS